MSKYSVEKNDLQKEVFIFGDDVDGVVDYTGSYVFTPKPFREQEYNIHEQHTKHGYTEGTKEHYKR